LSGAVGGYRDKEGLEDDSGIGRGELWLEKDTDRVGVWGLRNL